MTESAYSVRETTGDPDDPSVDEVIEMVLVRAANPSESPHGHVYEGLSGIVEEFGTDAVEECIRSDLVGGLTHRLAGRRAFGEENYIYGIVVGVAASEALRELREMNIDWEDTDLWQGVQDAMDDKFVRSDSEFEF